ncbi:acyclic terpene utilization AtuA family protein [Aspergillus candidus]|uniref:DUF1446 domain protein n=1 Tax=Aspergillus candidus TaxID=41067 RepID=A0A2I2F7A9_ASPCN|nr:DUF1446 domain protein [Aspergillus candidus]PLB36514.1 DUF1446 domain protein [Aspergillus candidus]
MTVASKPVRIAGCAGGNTDRWDSILSFAQDPSIDVIMGDWLSESNMASTAAVKAQALEASNKGKDQPGPPAYAKEFLQCFEPAIPHLSRNKIKLVVNAGAADTPRLARDCQTILEQAGSPLRIAWVEGDDVTTVLKDQIATESDQPGLISIASQQAADIDPECVFAQCYLGGWGIAAALSQGADVVLCGRVSDASPVVGAAAWWHGWTPTDYNQLARALIAGHLIECSGYATGGNYSGFKDLLNQRKHINVGFPIAEVDADGVFTISKERDTGGCVTTPSLTSQLIYEIQGPYYLNSDVVADISGVSMENVAPDVVRVTGVRGLPPPPTTKVGITTRGGYQAEFHAFMTGLDIDEKCRWTEEQIRHAMGDDIHRFTELRFHRVGTPVLDTPRQDDATVLFRVFAQTRDPEILRPDALTPTNDPRQASPKIYYNYLTGLIPQKALRHQVHCMFGDQRIVPVDAPEHTQVYGAQPSYDTKKPADLAIFGETDQAPLGRVACGRSGDKGADCNVGFFVQHDDEWEWLRTFLTCERIKELLGPVEYTGNPIERFEIPGTRTVHFLLRSHLDRGFNSSSSVDVLGKNTGEFLRSRTVAVPRVFLRRHGK